MTKSCRVKKIFVIDGGLDFYRRNNRGHQRLAQRPLLSSGLRLCQFAQLSLIQTLACLVLPPPSISLLDMPPTPILLIESSLPSTHFNRGPPA